MMSDFTGMALYNKDEIKSALSNYSDGLGDAQLLLANLILDAETNFTPTWWDSLWKINTLKAKYKQNSPSNWSYSSWLHVRGYVNLTAHEELEDYLGWSCRLDRWKDEFDQITNLTSGGKDCYLNPIQSEFVNKFIKRFDN